MISILAAFDEDRVIGYLGGIPWHISADLKRFKQLTVGNTVIMGRKTLESLPGGRPLKDRFNIVLTRSPGTIQYADGLVAAENFEMAVALANLNMKEIFVIGGQSVYEAAMPLADRLLVTEVKGKHLGDAYFPVITGRWQEVSREEHEGFAFVEFIPHVPTF